MAHSGSQLCPGKRPPMTTAPSSRSTRSELIYRQRLGLSTDDDVVAYCRIGETLSPHLVRPHPLLGSHQVRNYDGSWTEWGNLVGAPIER